MPLLISTSNCFASVMCERNLSIAWDFACPGSPRTKRFFLVSNARAMICISSSRSARLSDNLSGKITDERFQRMSVNYDNEQKDLRERLTRLNNILEELNCKTTSTEKFVEAVRKYTRVKKLTARMVTELIEHIEVHHTEKIDGVKTQKLVIYYNCIGSIEIPDEVPIPEADITMKTRKGVEVTYVPAATPATTAV